MRSTRPFACPLASAYPIAAAPSRPTPSGPGRPPSRAEELRIAAAVRRSPLVAHLPVAAYAVTDVRVSVRSPRWAYARLAPFPPGDVDGTLDPVVAVLDRRGSRWRLAEVGTAFVGSGAAPPDVLREFRLAAD